MAGDERFKRYQEVGADFLDAARVRAEEFLRELSKMGESTQKQAQDAVDDLVEGSHRGTEQIFTSIRREITAQLSQLGLATREDLASLERRLTGRGASPATPGNPTETPPTVSATGPTPAGSPATLAKKAAGAKAAAKKAAAAKKVAGKKVAGKKAAPAKKAPGGI